MSLHGTVDWMVSGYHSERLHEAAPQHSEFVSMPLLGHTTIWLDPTGAVDRRAQEWFDRRLCDVDAKPM